MSDLTDKQRKFVYEYMKDQNRTQAAIRAGFSEKTAHVAGCRLLKIVKVRAEVDRLLAEAAEAASVTAEYITVSLKKVAERCMQAEEVLDELGHPTGEWKFEHSGANRAFELLGRAKGMFKDTLDLTSKGERIVWIRPADYPGKPK